MQARAFNTVSVDHKNGIFTKSSVNTKKLRSEINYYLNLPKQIAALFPTLIDYESDYSAYRLEYVPYKNLAEYISTNRLSTTEGKHIIRQLLMILDEIHVVEPNFYESPAQISNFYIDKTLERINELKKDNFFRALLNHPTLEINGKSYKNFYSLQEEFIRHIKQFSTKYANIAAIHGDFCFSNILYAHNNMIKLIDPRGSFAEMGIYGHTYYDYAKLLHCLHGKYDFIAHDQFTLTHFSANSFEFTLPPSFLVDELYKYYISALTKRGMNIDFLYLIEASLFLSMTSLHYENKERQKVMFLQGLMLLNNVTEKMYAHMY